VRPTSSRRRAVHSTFETLKVFLDPINSITPRSYEEVAHQLQVSLGEVKTLIHRLRRWENGPFHHFFEGGQVLSSQDELSKLFQP
jgi:hypothetical protein